MKKSVTIYYDFLARLTPNRSQEIINPAPPKGVIAPSHLVSVKTRRYRLPENIAIEASSIQEMYFARRAFRLRLEVKMTSTPREWIN
jgi:hypothetical protein